jgi:PAS domain-containing protein
MDARDMIEYTLSRNTEPEKFRERVMSYYDHPEQSGFGVIELLDGRVFECYSQPQRVGGDVVGRVWSFRDVTGRLRTVTALRESEATLRSVLRAAPVGISFNRDRVLVSANDSLCDTLGYTEGELIGRDARIFYCNDREYGEAGRKLYPRLLEKGRASVETRFSLRE